MQPSPLDLTMAVHTDPQFKGMVVLMLTAVNTRVPLGFGKQDIDEEWMPVAGFLEKPVDLDLLRDKVGQLLAS